MRKALFFSLLFFGCAKFGPPPGGPEDKTAPEVLSVFPASGSITIDTGAFFEFTFSKKVERASLAKNVFISPALADSFHDELKGRTYRIYPNRYLKKGTTYIVTLGTGLRDLRGNSLAQAYSISISTGLTIDSGEIAGELFDKTSPMGQAAVQAYRITDTAETADWRKPDYRTATGELGRFKFSFLPYGSYRLLALAKDKFAWYHRDVSAGKVGEKMPPVQLFLEALDTSALTLAGAQFNRDRLLVLTFNRTLGFSDTLLANFRLAARESIPLQSGFVNPIEKDKLYLTANFPLKELEAKIYFSSSPEKSDSAGFLIGASPDMTPPRPAWFEPKDRQSRAGLSDTLKFHFSEPAALVSGGPPPGLYDSTGSTVPMVWSQPQANAFFFVPQKPLRAAERYLFRFPVGSLSDRSGNLSAESLTVFFSTYFPDSQGTVSGRLTDREAGKTIFEFRELSSGWSKSEAVADSLFSFQLLAGKYFLFGFSDKNGNGRRDGGSLSPFIFPEPAFFYPDTIFIRARFETEGIELTAP